MSDSARSMIKLSSRTKAQKLAKIASNMKALNIIVMDLRKLSSFTDFFVICSGRSDRHVKSIADAVHEKQKKNGYLPLGQEGKTSGHWVLLDYGDAVMHVFYDDDRKYYNLEDLWHDAPRVKFTGIS